MIQKSCIEILEALNRVRHTMIDIWQRKKKSALGLPSPLHNKGSTKPHFFWQKTFSWKRFSNSGQAESNFCGLGKRNCERCKTFLGSYIWSVLQIQLSFNLFHCLGVKNLKLYLFLIYCFNIIYLFCLWMSNRN